MKKVIVLFLLVFSYSAYATTWITSFDEAKKIALSTNKFMIVDFWATWCGPCKQMERDSWSDPKVNEILEYYVPVKLDLDKENELGKRFSVESIPNMFIMDGNGKVVHNFSGYHSADELKGELLKFAVSTAFISNDLINYYKSNNISSCCKVYMKCMDYSLMVDSQSKEKIIGLGNIYLDEAKNALSKKDADYLEKKQRLDLLRLFAMAYRMKFDKLSEKLSSYNENDISENNKSYYYFLKYISLKATNSNEFETFEAKVNAIDGFENFIGKANFILKKKDG